MELNTLYKDYNMKAQIIKDLREWHSYWPGMAWLVHSDTTGESLAAKWQNAKDYILAMEKELEEKGSCGGVGFPYHTPTATECIEILSGGHLDGEEIQAQVRWKGAQDCIKRKQSKAQGGNLRTIWKAMEISDKWPDAVRIAIYNKLQKIYSHVPTTPRPERSTTRQRTPRSHRVAVSVRGGDSGDDDSGESDPPAPPYVNCNPTPLLPLWKQIPAFSGGGFQLFPVDLISRVPMADGHFAWTFGGV